MSGPSPPIEAVLVYDDGCPRCSHAADALQAAPRVAPLAWSSERAQACLGAQFDEAPRATVLLDRANRQVYAGPAALRTLEERAETASLGERFVGADHDHVDGGVGDASAGEVRQVAGTHALSTAARPQLPALVAAAEREGDEGAER